MRTRTALPLTALVAAGLLALPLAASATAAPAPKPIPVAARSASTLTLVTGDRVRVGTAGGKQLIETLPAAASGKLATIRAGKDVYVIPATAKPYLGRQLDRNLFDVTALHAAVGADGRVPVRIAYTGSAKPSVPGVTVTQASGGVASGYVTSASASSFGKALKAQYKADAKAGFPVRSTLFPGVTKLAAAVPGSNPVTPKFPMYTLKIKGTGADGKALQDGFGFLLNVQDGRKFGAFLDFYQGEARASVPAGTYALIVDEFAYNEATDTSTDHLVTVDNYVVTGADQTLNVDARTATLPAGSVNTPKPSTVDDYLFEWQRTDALDYNGITWDAGAGPNAKLFVAPAGPATLGELDVLQTWSASQPGATKGYTYTLAQSASRIPATLTTTFTAAQLAERRVTYDTDGPTYDSGALRFPIYPWQFWIGGTFESVKTPTARTEYVGGNDSPIWGESYVADNSVFEDPGFWDSNAWQTLPGGSKSSTEWARGPLGAGVPVQAMPDSWGNYCWQCRTNRVLSTGLAPALDSTPDHSLEITGAEDGTPVTRFRFYENGSPVFDGDDYLGGIFDVPTTNTVYRAVLDIDRRLQEPKQSTRSTTEWTFRSAAGQGSILPASWFCDAAVTEDGTGCRVLPVVTAKLALPTTLNGRLPAGKSTVTVTAARVQNAEPGTIASAGLEVRVAGGSWKTVTLSRTANGVYTGVVDNTGLAGKDVDVRVTAKDSPGDAFTQTVLKAYTVAAA